MEPDEVFHPRWVCPRNADAHALCAKLAESEARVRELQEGDEALLAVLPEDFGAVEYIKHLTAANAALEAKLAEGGKALIWCYEKLDAGTRIFANQATHDAFYAAVAREEARKKGAEHGD
ncbi:MAG: hypothetical protein JSS77_16175 [Acidobacteria bacterium]|nr:hypothetical protein [Acidobacteriota bacterium]